jgi:hypothetical protein
MNTLDNKGQSSIEFIISFVFILAFVFMFLRLALNFATGYLAHYATFMASRVFLSQDMAVQSTQAVIGQASGGGGSDSASGLAQREFQKYRLDLVGVDTTSLRFNLPGQNNLYEYVGAIFELEKPITVLKVIGGESKVKLQSESFIGKEPPRIECYQRTCWAMSQSAEPCEDASRHLTLYDNGC